MIEFVTRAAFAVLYLSVAVYSMSTTDHLSPRRRPARRFLTGALLGWAAFYLFLAFVDPAPVAWVRGVSRALHIPLVAAIGLAIYAQHVERSNLARIADEHEQMADEVIRRIEGDDQDDDG